MYLTKPLYEGPRNHNRAQIMTGYGLRLLYLTKSIENRRISDFKIKIDICIRWLDFGVSIPSLDFEQCPVYLVLVGILRFWQIEPPILQLIV